MNSKEMVREIVEKIFSGELIANDKLPSEAQLSIKYNVSRIVATKAYETLKKIGAIYSISKKGFFVSEYFSGIIRSIDDEFSIDKIFDKKIGNKNPTIKNRIIEGEFFSFKRKHYKNDELIIESINWLDENYKKYVKDKDILADLIWSNKLISGLVHLSYEPFEAFGKKINLVKTTVYYSSNGIPFIQKSVIKPKYFELIKHEWAI